MRKNVLMSLSVLLVAGGGGMIYHYLSTVAGAEHARQDAVARFEARLPSPAAVPGAAEAGDSVTGSDTARVPVAAWPDTSAQAGDPPATGADAGPGGGEEEIVDAIEVPPPRPLAVARSQPQASREALRGRWLASSAAVDRSDWSAKREAAWASLLADPPAEPIALLDIPAVDLKVPVYDGATDANMDLGAGRIRGTTRVGEVGNIGLSSHRDGFFRNLQHISEGDELMLQDTTGQVKRYRVEAISIVTPQDVHVLYPDDRERLTLVTCYPFYFVGSAPQRFIVHAVADDLTLAERG